MPNHSDPCNHFACICVFLTRWVSIVTITLPRAQICASNDDDDTGHPRFRDDPQEVWEMCHYFWHLHYVHVALSTFCNL